MVPTTSSFSITYRDCFWSALATSPAETSAEAKVAFNFNKISSSSSSHFYLLTKKELSYDFETLRVVLSYQKNMIGTLKKNLTPPLHPPLWYILGWT